MIRSFAFTTQGRLHTKDIQMFLMPTLLADTNLFLWVDLEDPTPEETKAVLEDVFHFHPLSIEDCVMVSPSPKVEEYLPKEEDLFSSYLFMVIHAVDYSRKDGVFGTSELNFFLGRNFLVTYHEKPLKSVQLTAIVMANTDPRYGEELGAPIFQATVAAAMEYEVDVICTATSGRLMKKGVAESLVVKEGSPKTVYDFIKDAHEAGVKFYCCSPNLDLFDMSKDDLIPECAGS